MKLYTEEQVKAIADHAIQYGYWQEPENVIELPSYQDVENWAALTNPYMGKGTKEYREGFMKCAKWMRDKIKGDK